MGPEITTPPLSRRQQVITLHGEGLSQREIGRRLHISQPAVRKHLVRAGRLVPLQRPAPATAEPAPPCGEQEAPTAALPIPAPSTMEGMPATPWQEDSLDEVLTVAFRQGLRLMKDGSFLHFAYPIDFPPGLRAALERYEDELVDEINRTALRHPPCPACGNRLLFRRREAVLCPVCQGRLLGPDWVWARW
jgi:hypothetical protein